MISSNPDLVTNVTIQTFTGEMFDVFNPHPDQIKLRDISHSLSMTCRYGGHTYSFYSVAEHCVIMAEHFEMNGEHDLARAALLHDASEAYVGDLVRPIKLQMPTYREVEEKIQQAIFAKFGLPPNIPSDVKVADLAICNDEREALMLHRKWNIEPTPLGVEIRAWGPTQAEAAYIHAFWRLFG